MNKVTNLKVVKNVMSFGTKAAMAVSQNGPTVLVVAGVIGMVGGAIYAAHQATKLDRTLDEAKAIIEESKKEARTMNQPKATITKLVGFGKASWRLVKLFSGPIAMILFSAGGILYAFKVVNGRLVAVTGALVASQAEEKRAWGELSKAVGEERANDIRYDMHTEEKKIANKAGEEVKVKEKVMNDPDNPKTGQYSYLWEEVTVKPAWWEDDSFKNCKRLQQVETDLNNKLESNGYVFLNEALRQCGFRELPPIGQMVGWIDKGTGSRQISLGLNYPWAKRFINGLETNVTLSFNCDGYILDKVGKSLIW